MKPILIFPNPKVQPRPPSKSAFPGKQHLPTHARQKARLDSTFKLLETNFKNGILSDDSMGFAPERILVFETIGSVNNFYKAVSKIEGLDFVQEIFGGSLESDDDFYPLDDDGQREDKDQKSYVYLTMSNQTALHKILQFWNKYKQQENYVFPRGFTPLRHLFDHLKVIRYWDTNDRLYNTGIIEDWEDRVAGGQDIIPVEIEIWYNSDSNVRTSKESRISQLITKINGKILTTCQIDDIRYHAVLANIPVSSISQLLSENKTEIELMRCDEIMFFRPSGQCMTPVFHSEDEQEYDDENANNDVAEIIESPVVALIDGLPLEHHAWIKNYISIDDPDGWSSDYKPEDQKHGTSMASLIIRGDMQSEGPVIPRKLYCRPILKPENTLSGNTRERIPEGILPIDLVHRAVRRLYEPENGAEALAPTIKVINLSIADPSRLFEYQMSPWAKLIDYLSVKYQVLFVISAGNHIYDLELGITNKEFNKLSSEDKEALILGCISDTTHLRRLMSPAESINALTIGAYHHDENSDDEFYNQINPYTDRNMPSTINSVTWGKKRSVKPELLMPGGRATYKLKGYLDSDPAILKVLTYESPPGQKVASPGNSGSLKSFVHTFGTSNSTALASRRLCFLYDTIQDLYLSKHGHALSKKYEAVLLKALLCHGASLPRSYTKLEENLKNATNSKQFKAITAKYFGFGNVNEERIHGCIDEQATIIQCGEINQDDSHVYKFRLPESLSAKSDLRRLIITLAWFSPINSQNSMYREAHLYYEPITRDKPDNHLEIQDRELQWQMVRNGTVQHEVLSGDRASPYAVGTNLEIIVHCKGQAGAKNIVVPYGLVVTLDVPDSNLPIYEEVKSGIDIEFETQVGAGKPITP